MQNLAAGSECEILTAHSQEVSGSVAASLNSVVATRAFYDNCIKISFDGSLVFRHGSTTQSFLTIVLVIVVVVGGSGSSVNDISTDRGSSSASHDSRTRPSSLTMQTRR